MSSKDKPWSYVQSQEGSQTRRAARSYAALRRAAHPLNLPSHCKGFYGSSPCALALFWRGTGPVGTGAASAWQLRHAVARQIIVFRRITTLVLASFLFAFLSNAQTSDGRPPAN